MSPSDGLLCALVDLLWVLGSVVLSRSEDVVYSNLVSDDWRETPRCV